MKSKLLILLGIFAIAIAMVSCTKDEGGDEFESGMLVGRWRAGTEWWVYKTDNTGYTWDTSDDVTEAEAQPFKWTLVKDELGLRHYLEMSGEYDLPKYYTVTQLTSTTLKYKDDFNNTFTFTKVQ